MKKNITSKQHFVPKYYLNQFSYQIKKNGKKKRYFIHVHDSKKQRNFSTTTDNVAVEDEFYEAPDTPEMRINNEPVINQNEVEDFLQKLESMVAPYLLNLVNTLNTEQSSLVNILGQQETRLHIGLHYLLQYYRTIKWRRLVQSIEKKKLQQELIYKEFNDGWDTARYWKNLDILKAFSLQKATWEQIITLLDLEELNKDLNIIGNYIWAIAENNNEIPFITSDSPIIQFDYFPVDKLVYKCSALPLSPNYMIIIYHVYPNDQILGHLNNQILTLSNEDVKEFNSLQKEQCSRMLFSNKQILDQFFN